MRTKGKQSKLMKIITLPLRLLKKGRDLYVRSMLNISQKPIYGGSYNMSGSVNNGSKAGLPKSFSTSVTHSRTSNLEDDVVRDLIRANSTALNSNDVQYDKLRAEMDLYLKQLIKEKQVKMLEEIFESNVSFEGSSNGVLVPRSSSVGMEKIEEEDEEEEGIIDHNKKKSSEVMFPRSKSEAVTQTSAVF